ncbi:MAG: 2-hydroxyhepta-2,4-diene-1,7-dioate isomerase [Pelagibacteraceae bacterium BACL5 MAG-120820-bin39]|jgi:2,4-didehydro-3-deoxy-L-rhamnonate hydrolase|nr:MAG: 2-hydroxyhepta-2,4-diene-1,7-dioate isomerase [Pelagibacteraceae bacterium BACL5 MAG-121015-bin10]KRO63474.1 MAG: 2-hydroxyhepta-2,4-diene-1,7-dioate isomerase [Pelagibacteraceae bacterium BACL5 MAG-120820-bin39]
MKFLRVGSLGNEKPASLDKNGKLRDLSNYISDFNSDTINFETLNKLRNLDLETLPEINQETRIGACIKKPGNFFAIGLNYKEHAEETGAKAPDYPVLFNKSVHSIVGPNDNVIIPKNSLKLDHEVEIAFVIGKKAKRIEVNDAQDYIFGYCICNDISERDWQKDKGGQWVKGKSGDTFGPLGPYLVTKDEISDIYNINLSLDVNGRRHQTGNTKLMIFNFDFLLSHISQYITLMPGDIVTTGTPPGVGLGMNPPQFLKDGDEMYLKVDHLGEQKIKVISEK